MEKTRINKYLSEVGFCSRREADKMLEQGRITVNGTIPEMGTKVSEEDEILVDGISIRKPEEEHVYIALNKPVGIVCTTDTKREKNNIVDFINHPKRIFPIGRLDKPSEGLILLTSDGDIVNKILRARNNHEKEYIVRVDKHITPQFLHKMRNGIPILGTVTNKCEVEQIDTLSFRI
ncbi:MAG TPA: 23S rRNA pseudouridine synthase F, partial [Chryseobacterium sp.]|nr:23S rRNA pseudouridine synthase F [Chryseobacterium sp.]